MTQRRTVYLYPDDMERLKVLKNSYGLGTSAATRAGLALLLAHLQDEDRQLALDTTVGPVRREKEMIKVRIEHENDNRKEFGYGIYVNGYIEDDEFEDAPAGLYASECVPFGQNTPENLKAAERRVRRTAMRRYKKDWMQEN